MEKKNGTEHIHFGLDRLALDVLDASCVLIIRLPIDKDIKASKALNDQTYLLMVSLWQAMADPESRKCTSTPKQIIFATEIPPANYLPIRKPYLHPNIRITNWKLT